MQLTILQQIARNIQNVLDHGMHILRPHQTEACQAIADTLDKGDNTLYLDMATGSGKTMTFMTAAIAAGVPFIVVTPRQGLNEDSEHTLANKLKVNPNKFGVYDSTRGDTEKSTALAAQGLITSYDGFVNLAKAGLINPENRPLVIFDEMHRATGEVREAQIQPFLENSVVIGCSATPGPAVKLFGGKSPAYHLKLREAILRDNIVCKGAKTAAMEVTIDEEEFSAYKQDSDIPIAELERIANNDAMINSAIHFYATHHDDDIGQVFGKSTMLFTQGVEAAQKTADKFNKQFGKGFAVAISGDTPVAERKRIKADFESGKIKVLCNADLLIEGFDATNAQVCLSLRPTNQAWIASQQLGRVTRMHGDKIALGVNFYPKGMQPVLFGEVLGDAAIYSPTAVRNTHKGEPPQPATLLHPEKITLPDFTVYSDYTEMAKLITAAQEAHTDTRLPPPPEWWQNTSMIVERYVGDSSTINKKLESFRNELLAQETPKETVWKEWIGLYTGDNGREILYVSPKTISILEERGILVPNEKRPPPVPKNWYSAAALQDKYIGSSETINKKLEAFRDELIAKGVPEETVRTEWIGLYTGNGSRDALYASLQAIAALEKSGILIVKDKEKPRPAPENWQSVAALQKKYVGGDVNINKKLEAFRDELIAKGIPEETVRTEWVGRYTGSKGRDALFASLKAIAALEERGILVLNEKRPPSVPKNWQHAVVLQEKYLGYSVAINKKLEAFRDELIAKGIPEETVRTEWVGLYTGSTGKEALYVSPQAIAELEARGILVPKLQGQSTSHAGKHPKRDPRKPDGTGQKL